MVEGGVAVPADAIVDEGVSDHRLPVETAVPRASDALATSRREIPVKGPLASGNP